MSRLALWLESMGVAPEGWRPVLDPLELHHPWHGVALLLPLLFAVALIYKALKLPTLRNLAGETLRLTVYLAALMVTAAAVLWVIVDVLMA